MSKEEKKPVEITLEALQALVDAGKTKSEIGTHFGLSPVQTAKLLKEANLKPKRAVVPAFVLIKPTTEATTSAPTEAREVAKTEVKKEKATKEKVEKPEKVLEPKVESKPQVQDDSDLIHTTNKVDEQEAEQEEENETEIEW